MRTHARLVLLMLAGYAMFAVPGFGQNYSSDARRIAMGSTGETNNMASTLADESKPYRSIVLPFGLFQVLKELEIFDPTDDRFNPIRAMEYAASPLHYTLNRDTGTSDSALVTDIVNGRVSRDLNRYRGFTPESRLTARGLLAPTWGKTFHVVERDGGLFHGVYAGVGPYLSIGTTVDIDPRLIDLFSSSAAQYQPNTRFTIGNTSEGQFAGSITAGYRARFAVPGSSRTGSDRDGLYVAANYNYLRGFHYDAADTGIRLDTDSQGLLTLLPTTEPAVIDRVFSQRGSGFAVDVATNVIFDRWDFAFAASGIGNRIDWENLRSEQFVLTSLLAGLDFIERGLPSPAGKRRVELPTRYSGGGAYDADKWAVDAEIAHGLQDWEFHGGGEYRMGFIDVRGGGRYSRERWHPSVGIGLNFTSGFGIDLAAFQTTANIERERKIALAASLRFGR